MRFKPLVIIVAALTLLLAVKLIDGRISTDTDAGKDAGNDNIADTQEIPSIEEQRENLKLGAKQTLFTPSDSTNAIWRGRNPAAFRSRTIEPNHRLFTEIPTLRAGDRIEIPLFDDVVLNVQIRNVERNVTGAVGIKADVENGRSGIVYLSYSGDQVRLHADMFDGNDFYVRYDSASGKHIAIEIDKASSEHYGCELCASETNQAGQHESVAAGEGLASENVALSDGGSETVVVDWLVVYTPAAKSSEKQRRRAQWHQQQHYPSLVEGQRGPRKLRYEGGNQPGPYRRDCLR